jgi:hypothetical protein
MGDIRFDIDVRNEDIADEIEDAIERGISESVSQRNTDSLGQKMKRAAREHIRRNGRVWTTELINSFEITSESMGGNTILVLRNDAGHAAAIDTGAQYGDEGPPLHRLIPWVQEKMRGYRVDGGNLVKYAHDRGGTQLITDGGEVRGATLRLPPDFDVDNVQKLEDAGFSGGANRKDAYYVTFAGGESAYFQTFIDPNTMGGSDSGTVRNEALFTRISSAADWNIGPENKPGEIINPQDDEILEGNFQRWVDDANSMHDEVADAFTPAGYDMRWEPHEFMEENEDWLAQTTVLDMILGNTDRHEGNIVIGPDGTPHAIDNGGHSLPGVKPADELIEYNSVATVVDRFTQFDEFPELENAYQSLFERQLVLMEELLTNHADEILQHTKLVHGPHSEQTQRVEKILNQEVDDILNQIEEHQQTLLDTRTTSMDDIDAALQDSDVQDVDDILGSIGDGLSDL